MKTSFPKDKIEVLLLEGVHPAAEELFNNEGFTVRTQKGAMEPAEFHEAIARAHIAGIRSKTQITAEALSHAERLLTVGAFCIGTNQIDLTAAAAQGVPAFNAPFSNTRSVAELTIAETILLHRRVPERTAQMHAGRWVKSASGSHEVRGRTIGIVGYGHIGSQVSVLAEALGMRVIAYDLSPKLPLGNAELVSTLDELLERADTVTLHVPADSTTTNLIGRDQLAKMKPEAFLINNARGSVVDIEALAEALKANKLAGAAIDVFPDEPAKRDDTFQSPLLGIPNVILTPHVGGSTIEAQASIGREVATKLIKFVNNGSTTGSVNLPEVELPEQPKADTPEGKRRAHRLLHLHKNVPGVLSAVNNAISELGVNVASQRLETRNEYGYVVLDVDPANADQLKDAISKIPETIRTRILW